MHTDKREFKLVMYGYCMHVAQIKIPRNTLCCLAILTFCSAIIVYQTFWCFSSPLFKPFSLFLPLFSPHTHSLRSCCCDLHDVCNISSRTVTAICVINTHIHTCVKQQPCVKLEPKQCFFSMVLPDYELHEFLYALQNGGCQLHLRLDFIFWQKYVYPNKSRLSITLLILFFF